MARIKIDLPENNIATIEIKVRITDLNYGNHLGNDALVGILHEARVAWLQQYNYTELNIEAVGLIMSDLAVEYKRESFYGDVLRVSLFVAGVTRLSFELYYSVSNQHGELVARAKTGMVCYSYKEKKVAEIPARFLEILQRSQPGV